jgi:DNA-binding transcriptional regulator GbsR (MarR family)
MKPVSSKSISKSERQNSERQNAERSLGDRQTGDRHSGERTPQEILQLADRIGQFIEFWGFKKIHGKIWTLLYLSQDPLSATDICKRLNVSKTLLSFSISELLEYHVIQEDSKGPKRTIYYRANDDVTSVVLNVLRGRERPLLEEVLIAHAAVKKTVKNEKSDFKLKSSRMTDLEGMITAAVTALEALTLIIPSDSNLTDRFNLVGELLTPQEN